MAPRLFALKVLLLFSFASIPVSAQWTNLSTGINDNLTGAVFLGQNALASGGNGLYFTTSGGSGVASWTRFTIIDNAAASAIYENTSFTHCYADNAGAATSGFVYACGRNNATSKAVIFKILLPSMAYEIIYQGPVNSRLNKIDGYQGTFLAAGDDGLLVGFSSSAVHTIATGINEHLRSVSVYQNWALLGSNQKMYRMPYTINSVGTITEVPTPDVNHKDVFLVNNTNAYTLAGESFSYAFLTTPPQPVVSNPNFVAPLNANGLTYFSGRFYVGTATGIYKSSAGSIFQNTALEWQPSGLTPGVNDFWFQTGVSTLYAFGNNGLILKTTNGGGATKPYVRITSEGGCYPGSTNLRAITGSANSYNWYVNGNWVSSSSNNITYTFPAAGAYLVSLTVQNSFGEQSTDTKTVHMVPVPLVNKPFTLSDNILCKAETTQITITDSQPNVYYILKLEGQADSNFGQSVAGNGSSITFTTGLIDLTGLYYLYAKSTLADCGDRFSGNFLITVEETAANFHAGVINAHLGEPVRYFENSVDAQNFEWQFSAGASTPSTATANPVISFNTTGLATTTLHAWSDNDCHDTVTNLKPNVYELPASQDDCFLLVNNSTDPAWTGSYNPDISQMVPTADGFLICGTYFNQIFDSRFGIVKEMPGQKGGYLAQYDRNGVIKWVVYNLNTQLGNNNNVVYSAAVDSQGNIYLSGRGLGKFIDNKGQVTNLSATNSEYYLMKLNSKGEKIWLLQTMSVPFAKIAVDRQDNVVALTGLTGFLTNVPLYFNGQFIQNIGLQPVPDAQFGIFKFSGSGAMLWEAKVNLASSNAREFSALGFDNANHLYVGAAFDGSATVYHPDGSSTTIPGDGSYGSKIGLYKLNPQGNLIWKLRSRTVNSQNFPSDQTQAHAMVIQGDGTIYLTGQNGNGQNVLGMTSHEHRIESTDGSFLSSQGGEYFVTKISADGVAQWLRTASTTYYGLGTAILKSGNEIHVVGQIKNNGAENCTATFDSADAIGYALTINSFDYFVAVYSESGILQRIFVNNEGSNAAIHDNVSGFFKGDADYFYLAKNLTPMSGGEIYTDFGMTSPSLNGRDGTIVRFTQDCGILKYDRGLGIETLNALERAQLVPNPVQEDFAIDLREHFDTVNVVITDITGKTIANKQFTNIQLIQMTLTAASGIYFVQVKAGDQVRTFKVAKQ
jgi:PKD repeat protein